jgi:phage repressor protein C with HTH and peptisase S24 domain/DNA-binding XRE family transcriptional regulator
MELKDNVKRLREAQGLSQADLGRLAGASQQVIADIESGRTLRPRQLFRIAEALGVAVGELDPSIRGDHGPAPVAGPYSLGLGRKDLPIYSAAEGGGGSMIVSWDPIEFVVRPSPLANIRGGYGIYVVGDSMVPAFEPGDIALINPHLPAAMNRDAVFFRTDRSAATEALIKRLLKASPREWRVQQWNPGRQFTLSRAEWNQCHIVVGKYSR